MTEAFTTAAFKHVFHFTVLEHHLDTFSHVNHAVYFQLFEQARWQMVTERGFGLKKVHEVRQAPVILHAAVEYKRELNLRDTVRIETVIGSNSRRTAQVCQQMINAEEKLIAYGEFKFALFDLDTRRILTPTKEWLYALGIEE